MNITEIRNYKQYPTETSNLAKSEQVAKTVSKAVDKNDVKTASPNWQKNILLQALDMLENNIQVGGDHPLDKPSNTPIESFDEALIELSFLKSPTFKEEASAAQANIKPEDILSLFVGEAA